MNFVKFTYGNNPVYVNPALVAGVSGIGNDTVIYTGTMTIAVSEPIDEVVSKLRGPVFDDADDQEPEKA